METTQIILMIIGAALGLGGVYVLTGRDSKHAHTLNEQKIRKILNEAENEAMAIRHELKAKKQEILKSEHEETERMEAHTNRLKESLELKQKHVQSRVDKNSHLEGIIAQENEEIQTMQKTREADAKSIVNVLSEKTGVPVERAIEEARNGLVNEIQARHDKFVQSRVQLAEEDSLKTAQSKLVIALQKYSDTSSVDRTETAVIVKNERFKPDIIGPQGELIDYLEEKLDIEAIFNDYPKTITVGGYNVLKRQVGKETLDILQKEKGQITIAKIDSAIEKAQKKVDNTMIEKAKDACKKIGIENAPEGLLRYIGRLHFRTSYGQNALKHCLEVGFFAGILAAEIGADIKVARIAGFFHDVGKAISEESDKGHDYLTKDILEEFQYPEPIIHAAWVHHEAEPARSLEAKLVMAADALSASRPGARLESLERYLRRIRELEGAANSFSGVKKTFAVSAGREIRVIVKPEEVTDEMMIELAHNIADKIENELTYPGNVKVNVIRRRKWNSKAKGTAK